MELIVKQLIGHDYTIEDLSRYCSPDTIKDTNLEWNEKEHQIHPYNKDISDNDIVFSVKWCGRTEEYAYFFFKKDVKEHVTIYSFEKSIVDSNLPEEYIKETLNSVIRLLNNGNYLQIDRLFYGDNNYPLVEYQLDDTISKITNNFLLRFQAEKTGIAPLPRIIMGGNKNAPE